MSDELILFASRLVAAASVLGNEGEVARLVVEEMRRLGFDGVETDAVGNVVGVIEGARAGGTLLFDAHMDTVDVVPLEEWRRDPWSGEVVDGRLHGRGAADMKGALAAMVHAAAAVERRSSSGRLVVSATVNEETIEGAALRAVMERYAPDAVVIGEASDLDLVRAGRGRAELVVTTRGRSAHASMPHLGVHAVHRMCAAIAAIEALPLPSHPFVGSGVMCLTDIVSAPYPGHSVVPVRCRATYERRLLPGETECGLRAEIEAACTAAGVEVGVELAEAAVTTYSGFSWREPKWYPPWELAEDHALVRRGLDRLRQVGLEPALAAYPFCTNAAYSAGRAGVPTLGFGPATAADLHVVDESVAVEDLVAACRGYSALAGLLSG